MKIRKTPLATDMLNLLRRGKIQLPPLVVQGVQQARGGGTETIVNAVWGRQRYRFAAECKQLWTPKAVSEMVARVRQRARPGELYPLVVVPYLPPERLAELEAEGISGIDLCGNGIVVVPNELMVYRTGSPNVFRSDAEIKNVFRGDSSLVSRSFLALPEYGSVQEVCREIEKRGGRITLPTVSKVCKNLEEMLLIERKRVKGTAARQLRLLQRDRLLDLLAANYAAPVATRVERGKLKLAASDVWKVLSRVENSGVKVVQTGFGSAGNYAVIAKEPMLYFYCSDVDAVLQALSDQFEPTERFANVAFTETKDATMYFDRRPDFVASPVQTYLELSSGDKRLRETAEQVRRVILAQAETARTRKI